MASSAQAPAPPPLRASTALNLEPVADMRMAMDSDVGAKPMEEVHSCTPAEALPTEAAGKPLMSRAPEEKEVVSAAPPGRGTVRLPAPALAAPVPASKFQPARMETGAALALGVSGGVGGDVGEVEGTSGGVALAEGVPLGVGGTLPVPLAEGVPLGVALPLGV